MGVRINESGDDHDFYTEANRVAHELDSTRPTAGVRFTTSSEFLEDAFAMNDFLLGNEEWAATVCAPRSAHSRKPPALPAPCPISPPNMAGHMYPAKSFDQEQRQSERVLRHRPHHRRLQLSAA